LNAPVAVTKNTSGQAEEHPSEQLKSIEKKIGDKETGQRKRHQRIVH
jgi:hypothetical protein